MYYLLALLSAVVNPSPQPQLSDLPEVRWVLLHRSLVYIRIINDELVITAKIAKRSPRLAGECEARTAKLLKKRNEHAQECWKLGCELVESYHLKMNVTLYLVW